MGYPTVLSPESPQAQDVLNLFWVVLGISAVIFTTVATLVVIIVLRFRRRSDDVGPPPQVTGNLRLEILWTVVPFLILAVLFGITVRAMSIIDPPAHDRSPDLEVVAHQWWWEGHYPETGAVVANEFHLPAGRTLLLRFHSGDVVHDWWVPELGRKIDIFPNHRTHLWMKIDEPGTYLGTCDEFCGPEHAWMRIRVIAHTPAGYQAWMQAQLEPPREPTSPDAEAGRHVFRTRTCVSCHTIRGVSDANIGPDLTHVGSRETLAAGALSNDHQNLARWVHDAQAIKPDCNMPNMGLSMAQSSQVATYLEGLK